MSGAEIAGTLNGPKSIGAGSTSNADVVDRLKAQLSQEKLKLARTEDTKEKEKIKKAIDALAARISTLETRSTSNSQTNNTEGTKTVEANSAERISAAGLDETARSEEHRRNEQDSRKPGFVLDRIA